MSDGRATSAERHEAGALAIVVEDGEGHVLGCNEGGRALLAGLQGGTLSVAALDELRRTARGRGAAEGEVALTGADGERVRVDALVTGNEASSGEPTGYLFVLTSDRLAAKRRAEVRHDLRSTLSSVIGFAELLASERLGAVPTRHRELLADIANGARRALRIVGRGDEPAGRKMRDDPAVRAAESARAPERGSCLVVARDHADGARARELLRRTGRAVDLARPGAETRHLVEERAYDALAIDAFEDEAELLGVLRTSLLGRGATLEAALVGVVHDGDVLVHPVTDVVPVVAAVDDLAATLRRAGVPRPCRALLVCGAADAPTLPGRLGGLGLDLTVATSLKDALAASTDAGGAPAIVFLDASMRDVESLELVSQLRYVQRLQSTPIVALVGRRAPAGPTPPGPPASGRRPDGLFVALAARGSDRTTASLASLAFGPRGSEVPDAG